MVIVYTFRLPDLVIEDWEVSPLPPLIKYVSPGLVIALGSEAMELLINDNSKQV